MGMFHRIGAGLAIAAGLLALPAFAASTVRYVMLVDGGKQAGHHSVTTGDDGVSRSEYYFKDNGRGPELKEEFSLLPDGGFRHYHVSGKTTFGAKVDERYDAVDGRATWNSGIDTGDQPLVKGAFYAPLNDGFGTFSALVQAMAANPEGSVALIPHGTLKMREIDRMPVSRNGQSQTVRLMQLTGFGFTPTYVWITDDPKPRFFGFIAPGWMQMVEEGWQANAGAMETRQKAAESKALLDLQTRMAHRISGATLIHNVRVFDSATATLSAPSSVLIRDGKIVRVGAGDWSSADHGQTMDDHLGIQQTIDGGGRVLMPGLFDMHAHMDRWSGGLDIAAGVTSVRDMGNDNATLQETMRMERDGSLLMPRIVAAGFLEGESPMSARNGFVVKDLAGAKKAVDWYAEHGYPQIKIYNSFPKAILKDTVAYAHGKGLRVSGHIPVYLRAQDAVDAGYDEIQHINQVLLNFLVKPDTDTRTLERFYLPAREVAGMDFDAKPVQDYIAMLAKKQIVIDPTLTAFQFLAQRNGQQSASFVGVEDHLPPSVVRTGKVAQLEIPDDATAARFRQSTDKLGDFTARLYRAGVPLVAGTDDVPGFALLRELELYVQAGLTPAEVLQIATRNGAKYSYVDKTLGSVEAGKTADLILVDGDPTTNISDLRKVATVIKGDVIYYPSEIHTELGIKPFAEPVRPVSQAAAK